MPGGCCGVIHGLCGGLGWGEESQAWGDKRVWRGRAPLAPGGGKTARCC